MPMRQTLRAPKTVTNYDSNTNSWITTLAPTPQPVDRSTRAPETVNTPASPPPVSVEQAQYVTDLALRPRPMPFGSNNNPPGSHTRSLSQTLPAIFRGNRKASANESSRSSPQDPYDASDPLSPKKKSSTKKQDDANNSAGRCATCGSKVSYPKDVLEFRCTVCLMVNDLKIRPPRHVRRGEAAIGESLRDDSTSTGIILTLEETKKLVNKCIDDHLYSRRGPRAASSSVLSNRATRPPNAIQQRATDPVRPQDQSFSRQGPARPYPSPQNMQPQSNGLPGSSKPRPHAHQQHSYGQRPPVAPSSPSTANQHAASQSRNNASLSPRQPAPGPLQLPHRSFSIPIQNGATPSPGPQPFSPFAETDEDVAMDDQVHQPSTKSIFKSLEDYIIRTFGEFEGLNTAFTIGRPRLRPTHANTDPLLKTSSSRRPPAPAKLDDAPLPELDAKTLLMGDLGESALWWAGEEENMEPTKPHRSKPAAVKQTQNDLVNSKSPRINWDEVNAWYKLVLLVGMNWEERLPPGFRMSPPERDEITASLSEARAHVQRTILKASENLLRRPGRPLSETSDMRFLVILLANPMLYPTSVSPLSAYIARADPAAGLLQTPGVNGVPQSPTKKRVVGTWEQGSAYGIVKRIMGLLSNLSNDCHRYLLSWFSRYNENPFRELIGLLQAFVNHRLERQHTRKRSNNNNNGAASMIPGLANNSEASAQLHAALGLTPQVKQAEADSKLPSYTADWQIKSTARIMSLLFSANKSFHGERSSPLDAQDIDPNAISRRGMKHHGQLLSTSDFYNSMVDQADMVIDFDAWETLRDRFTFCQYPFLLSVGSKIKIMEHDARRQMAVKEREAFFNSILRDQNLDRHIMLKVRRDCLAEDSLKSISAVVGTGQEEIKKGLRVQFVGEEGVDAGGLRKEWFLLLVREIFDPSHGLFVYDEESQFCYFNPYSFELSEKYYLVGVLLGLAIYNSTILDVALPPFTFKKLLASGSVGATQAQTSVNRTAVQYTLDDLAELHPTLAQGLKRLLEYEGDIEDLGLDNVAVVDIYDVKQEIVLASDGERRPITNENRQDFVNSYVRYLLDTQVAKQFEPFKRGFFTVCGGNALSLFQPEEIELLVRGSDEPLDVGALKAVAVYENWRRQEKDILDPLNEVIHIQWFWEFFEQADPKSQRRILGFITGSDRIPAMGAASLVIKIAFAGKDYRRFPIARTCFNQLMLWKYRSKEELVDKVWRAVTESEGFGLK